MSNGQVPLDDNDKPALGLWDSTGHQIVPAQAVSIATDSTGQKYGVMNVNASFSASSLAINDPTTTTQKAGVNAGGSLQVAGQGTAGTPAGGVISIQGVASGTAIPISGSITATNPSVGTDGSAIPASSTLIGGSDGTNLQQLLVESAANRNLRTGIYSGANEATVTGANALKVDNSAVTQPVSGTVTANAGTGSFTVAQATGTNLHTVLDSGSTTAVTQATGTNLHTVVDSGTVTAAQATASNLNAQIVGPVASAGANAGNPVKVGGAFNTTQPTVTTGQIVDAQMTARGAQIVSTGTDTFNVTVNAALPTGANTIGTVNAIQSGTFTVQPGNTANTTPWLATINQGGNSATVASLTNSKALAVEIVDGSGTQITTFGGSSASTSATGAAVPASGTYIAGNKAGNLTGISLDGSGNINVNVAAGGASGGTSSTFGAAFPATGTALGASDGTNMQGLLVESSSNKNLRVALYNGTTEAGVTASGLAVQQATGSNLHTVVDSGTITANVGTTNGLALDTSVNGMIVAQGSTTSGEKGALVQGAVTTGAPTYTTAQTSPISLTTAGAIRVDASATTQPVSGTFWQATQPVSGTVTANAGTGNFTVVQSTGTNLHVVNDAGSAVIGSVTIQATSGTALVADQTNSELRISNYVTKTTPGDTALTLGSTTSANSMPVVIASDQAAIAVTATTNADTTIGGTTAPSKELLVAGKTNDGTAQYQPIPEGAGGRSIIVEGYAGGTAQPVSGTFWQATQPVSGTVTMNAGAGTMNVSQLAAGSVSGTLQTAQAGNAAGTPLSLLGMGVAMLTVNMAGFTGTVNFEGQEDGTNFKALNAVQVGTNTITLTTVGSTTTSIALYEIPVAGLQQIQARTSGVSAGTVTVTAHAVPVPYNGKVVNANQSGTWTVGLNAGAAVIGSTTIQATSGTALVADQTNSELRVSNYVKTTTAGDTPLTLGSATSANSMPVVIASDQAAIASKRSTVAAYTLASTATSGSTQNSGDIAVGSYREVSIDINTTAQSGTAPTLQLFYERKGADGIYYVLWQSTVLTTAANTLSTSIGAGMAYNQSLGITGRLRWVVGGSATPTYTFSANIYGK